MKPNKQYFIHNVPGIWFVEFQRGYKRYLATTDNRFPALSRAMTNMMVVNTFKDAFSYYKAMKIACIKNFVNHDKLYFEEFEFGYQYSEKRGFHRYRKRINTYYKL